MDFKYKTLPWNSFGRGLWPGTLAGDFGRGLWPGTLAEDFGRGLWPGTLAGDFGRGLWPGTLAGNFGRGLWPGTLAGDFGRRLWPGSLAVIGVVIGLCLFSTSVLLLTCNRNEQSTSATMPPLIMDNPTAKLIFEDQYFPTARSPNQSREFKERASRKTFAPVRGPDNWQPRIGQLTPQCLAQEKRSKPG